MIGLFEFDLALPLKHCEQLTIINYNLNLIKLYLACAKQIAAVVTVNNVCSTLTHRLYLIQSYNSNSLLLYFEKVYYEIFFSLKYLFHFFELVVDNTLYENNVMEM